MNDYFGVFYVSRIFFLEIVNPDVGRLRVGKERGGVTSTRNDSNFGSSDEKRIQDCQETRKDKRNVSAQGTKILKKNKQTGEMTKNR